MTGKRQAMGKRFPRKKITAVFLAAALLFCGCGADSDGQGTEGKAASAAMGRYLEESFPTKYENYRPMELLPAESGIYLVRDQLMDEIVNTETMKSKLQLQYPQAFRTITEGQGIINMAVAENGARLFTLYKSGENNTSLFLSYFLTPEGELREWDTVGEENRAYFWYGRDGYFYVNARADTSYGGGDVLYRVDTETGETDYLWDFPGNVVYLAVSGEYLFADCGGTLMIYSLSSKERLSEDSVLNETLKKYLGEYEGDFSRIYLIAPSQKEEGIYVLTHEGLFYHVMYGTVMEQMIEGSLCSIGDISKCFSALYVDETGDMPVFYVAYDSGKASRFVYDSAEPAVPETMLRVYSLQEDSNVRQAVTGYQGMHPELYVQYEIGVMEDSGQTPEDALKNLATQIASGAGPDVLVMDGLPYESYVEKGILEDLTELYAALSAQELYFDNVTDCLERDGKRYTIPAAFQITILMGERETIEAADNLEGLVSLLEGLDGEGASKIGLVTEDRILTAISMVSDGWINEYGALDKEALSRFLKLCRRIYEADRAQISEEKLEYSIQRYMDSFWYYGGGPAYDFKNGNNLYCISVLEDSYTYFQNPLYLGILSGDTAKELGNLLAALYYRGDDYRILTDGGTSCIPLSMLAVNDASSVKNEAEDFLKYALGAEFQGNTVLSGIPINKNALYAMEVNPRPGIEYYAAGTLGSPYAANSDYVVLEVAWASSEEFEKLHRILESIDRANIYDDIVYNTVMELGVMAVNGEKSVEETVDAIEKKVQLYLAE